MNKLILPALLSLACLLPSCMRDIDLEHYRGEAKPTLTSVMTSDTVVMADVSYSWFFTDTKPGEDITGLNVDVFINSELKERMTYDGEKYISNVRPQGGDTVTIRTEVDGQPLQATDIIPKPAKIEGLRILHSKVPSPYPQYEWKDGQYIEIKEVDRFTYKVRFRDEPGKANYYFLRIDSQLFTFGEFNYSYDPVFQTAYEKIYGSIHSSDFGSIYGMPFTDEGIEGKEYELTVTEDIYINDNIKYPRTIRLYAISEAYFRYLITIMANQGDESMQGGMIDAGMAEPKPIYCNVEGGLGIVCGIQTDEMEIQLEDFK